MPHRCGLWRWWCDGPCCPREPAPTLSFPGRLPPHSSPSAQEPHGFPGPLPPWPPARPVALSPALVGPFLCSPNSVEADLGDSDGRGVGVAAVDRDAACVQAAVSPPGRGLPTPGVRPPPEGRVPLRPAGRGCLGPSTPRGRGEEGEPSADRAGTDLGLDLNGSHRQVVSRGGTRSHPPRGLWADAWRAGCGEGTARWHTGGRGHLRGSVA